MSINDSSKKQLGNTLLIVLAGITGLFLCLCMALAGFAIGRASTSAATITETITQVLEVTREVVVSPDGSVAREDESAAPEVEVEVISPTAEPPDSTTSPPASQTPVEDIDLDVFFEAWKIIEQEFDGEIPAHEELLYSAISGSIDALDDDYTRFVRPELAARLREDMGGSVEGIGAFVRENEEGLIEIVRPIDGQPADLAGLLPGDIIISVDGESVLDLSFDEVLLKVRGPRGTSVTLGIAREGEEEPLEFTITRTRFEVPIIEAEMLPQDIAYIHLTEFNRNASERLLEALEELLAQNPRALIFDLRDNPGGFLDQSIAVADAFLPQSVVLFERNNRGLDEIFSADDGDIAEQIPMVVLINAGSASASEIVAGAIQDHGRAVLIGETTFGKGSVQQVHQLSDGSELRVTIARWYTPDNNSIDKEGVAPDIEVESPLEFTLGGEDDVQLQRAVEYIMTGQ